jgi:hypothetical protein
VIQFGFAGVVPDVVIRFGFAGVVPDVVIRFGFAGVVPDVGFVLLQQAFDWLRRAFRVVRFDSSCDLPKQMQRRRILVVVLRTCRARSNAVLLNKKRTKLRREEVSGARRSKYRYGALGRKAAALTGHAGTAPQQ